MSDITDAVSDITDAVSDSTDAVSDSTDAVSDMTTAQNQPDVAIATPKPRAMGRGQRMFGHLREPERPPGRHDHDDDVTRNAEPPAPEML